MTSWQVKENHLAMHIEAWYNEVKDFPAANVGAYTEEGGSTGMVGHYTQVFDIILIELQIVP